MKIRPAIIPDSGETLPSQFGRLTNRRMARPAIDTATSTANTATKLK